MTLSKPETSPWHTTERESALVEIIRRQERSLALATEAVAAAAQRAEETRILLAEVATMLAQTVRATNELR